MPALALAAALTCAWPASAAADQAVVSATIYPSSGGSATHSTIGTDALAPCPEYTEPSPIYTYPGGPAPPQPFELTQTSWLLSTVVTCGLQVVGSDVNSVEIFNPNHGFEDPLSNPDLTDTTRYQDPQAPGALPVISHDGGEDQTTYIRPYRGPGDANARDEVTEPGPITIVVYAHGAPLIVHLSSTTLSSTATATTAQFSAVVQTAVGVRLSASALTWSWNFGGQGTSAAPSPKHQFAGGSYPVTVQVSEKNGGNGGTGTILFQTPAKPTSGKNKQPGSTKRTKSKSPTGTENGKHSNHQGGQGGSHRSGGSGGGASTTPSPSTASTPSTSTATPSTTGTASAATPPPAATTPTTTTPPPHRTAPRRPRRATPTAPAGTLVTGRLVSDVVTLPASSSPLVRAAPAAAAPPQVRQATRSESLAAPAAGLVVALLLGLGAWWELRGRRRWRAAFARH